MARPRLKIDLEQVKTLYGIQCTDPEVAAVLGIDLATLMRRKAGSKTFRDLCERAKESGKASVRRAQYKLAIEGNLGAQIWFGKNYLGQRDDAYLHHVGADGGPIRIDQRAIIASIGDPRCWEQLAEAADALCRSEDQPGGPGAADNLRTDEALAALPAPQGPESSIAPSVVGSMQKTNGIHATTARQEQPGLPILPSVPLGEKS